MVWMGSEKLTEGTKKVISKYYGSERMPNIIKYCQIDDLIQKETAFILRRSEKNLYTMILSKCTPNTTEKFRNSRSDNSELNTTRWCFVVIDIYFIASKSIKELFYILGHCKINNPLLEGSLNFKCYSCK